VCEGTTDSEIKSADKKKEEFIETLKYADRLLKEFDNDLNKVAQQLNKEGKRTYLGHSWLVDNLRVSLKRLYDGKYGPYYK
jgi:flagellar biosynthesis regulator FlaF